VGPWRAAQQLYQGQRAVSWRVLKHGGGKRTATPFQVRSPGEIPLDPKITAGGDEGLPIVAGHPKSPVTAAYMRIADAGARAVDA